MNSIMIEPILKYFPPSEKEFVIFDIGSRDCKQSLEFLSHFPNSKIYAFECNPNTLPICKENIKDQTNKITLIEGAVTDYDGAITFYPIDQAKTRTTWKDGNPGASSLFKSNGAYNIEHYIQYDISVNCHRLDTVITKRNIPAVDVIWMDLQGAELLALKSLGHYLSTVKIIFTEVSHKPIYTNQVLFPELHQFLQSAGFVLANNLSGRGWQEDAVYIRR
jgi:FkbM family methyltransferase